MSEERAIDSQYTREFMNGEIQHHYGDKVHIFFDCFQLGKLEALGSFETTNLATRLSLSNQLTTTLVELIAGRVFPSYDAATRTNMYQWEKRGVYRGPMIDRHTRIVLPEVSTGSAAPVQTALEVLARYHKGKVQRHVFRKEKENEREMIIPSRAQPLRENTYLMIIDPIGARGTHSLPVLDFYFKKVRDNISDNVVDSGQLQDDSPLPSKTILAHFVITPEYIRNIRKAGFSEAEIFAFRLDRGLSSRKALDAIPGEYPEEEFGVTTAQSHPDKANMVIPGLGDYARMMCGTDV